MMLAVVNMQRLPMPDREHADSPDATHGKYIPSEPFSVSNTIKSFKNYIQLSAVHHRTPDF